MAVFMVPTDYMFHKIKSLLSGPLEENSLTSDLEPYLQFKIN